MNKDLVDLKDFIEKLSKVEIEKIELPKIYIPNWPEGISLRIELGKRKYVLPDTLIQGADGFCKLVREKKKISFNIESDGSIRFYIGEDKYLSDAKGEFYRMTALILFNQFKEELYLKVIEKLKKHAGEHNQVIEMVRKALEPFIPVLAAEKLSD